MVKEFVAVTKAS